jgi:hypothetical protein
VALAKKRKPTPAVCTGQLALKTMSEELDQKLHLVLVAQDEAPETPGYTAETVEGRIPGVPNRRLHGVYGGRHVQH